uniref:Transposase n=1 Tax=Steinernema glaseri TaxID=37863 RepID=A0A1I7YB99_9BILA
MSYFRKHDVWDGLTRQKVLGKNQFCGVKFRMRIEVRRIASEDQTLEKIFGQDTGGSIVCLYWYLARRNKVKVKSN